MPKHEKRSMSQQLGLFPDAEPHSGRAGGVGPAPVAADVERIAGALPEGLRLGTSSWSFPGWAGLVYDREASASTLAKSGLAAYARSPLLRTVGVDRTYYRPVSADVFREYASDVPDGFRFLVKADRRTTSPTDPDAPGRRAANPDFLDPAYAVREVIEPAVEGLGRKLGPILFQFSPGSPAALGGVRSFLERLSRFLGALPEGPRYAVELRTPELLTEAYREVLERHAVAHGYVVHPAMAPLEHQTALLPPHYQPTLVVRWMLGGGLAYQAARERYEPFDRIVDEDSATRHAVAVAALDALIAEREVFVVANNKAEGSAPRTLERLAEHIVRWRDPEPSPPTGPADAP
jgi:uncharacterized protein YecE (DUF72 family)